MKFREKLNTKNFIISAEITPPKGTNCEAMLDIARKVKPEVDAVNITDSPMATMKMSSLMAAHIIQTEVELETIPHLTCRDKNIIALQGDILGAAKLGINNVLALTGDDPAAGDHPQATAVFDTDSVGLISALHNLNQGVDYNGNQLTGSSNLTIGAAANLGAEDLDEEIERLSSKVEAGVDFIQTQPAYDLELVKEFLAKTDHLDVPILFGILPLTSYGMAEYLDQNVPGVEIPPALLKRMKGQEAAEGIKIASEFLTKAHSLIDGIHIMSPNRSDILLDILSAIT